MADSFLARVHQYSLLMRLDKPIGNFLLLWPTLVALWIASVGFPSLKNLFIFIGGVFLMRAAGCILNDLADRKLDPHVSRTNQRPLATGRISVKEAIMLCMVLLGIAFCLVLFLNGLALLIALLGVVLTGVYPFTKRFTHLPQLILGVTWNLGILMAFATVTTKIPAIAWLLYLIAVIWTVVFDTMYGMTDRSDDIKIGIKSTAILFGSYDRFVLAVLQINIILLLVILGDFLRANAYFYVSLVVTSSFFVYQQFLIRERKEKDCLKAFLNNNWAWLMVFIGIFLNYF